MSRRPLPRYALSKFDIGSRSGVVGGGVGCSPTLLFRRLRACEPANAICERKVSGQGGFTGRSLQGEVCRHCDAHKRRLHLVFHLVLKPDFSCELEF